ncbi:MAG: sel1 repeat family protein [Muribaculaceae bacterium]|nr:sel1 repeat family protein [Muribaculaceae bacterium]
MRKIFILISILSIAVSGQATGRENTSSRTTNSVSVSSQNSMSAAASRKADALYESVSKSYRQGKLSADGVVDKALYHKVWSPQLAARCLELVSGTNPRAMTELGYLYTDYKTAYMFPDKEAEGVRLLETATRSGNHDAADYLGVYYCHKEDYKKAMQYFKVAAPNNNPVALRYIGGMYDSGNGYKKDFAKARKYFERSAMMGNASGAAKYGLKLQHARYGSVDMPDAFMWLYIGGDLGDDSARSNLELPLRGERFGDDKRTEFMRHALALGNAWNKEYGHKFSTTPLYIEGFKAGLNEQDEAAEKGNDWALFYLGSMSYNDEFLNRNYDLIQKCYSAIIDHGTLAKPALALVYERMGEMYRNGHGVKANAAKATEYTRKAAELGSLAAYKIVEQIPD